MSLKYEKKDIYTNLDDKSLKAVDKYSKEYIQFLSECKTERLCVKRSVKMLEADGFKKIDSFEKLKRQFIKLFRVSRNIEFQVVIYVSCTRAN